LRVILSSCLKEFGIFSPPLLLSKTPPLCAFSPPRYFRADAAVSRIDFLMAILRLPFFFHVMVAPFMKACPPKNFLSSLPLSDPLGWLSFAISRAHMSEVSFLPSPAPAFFCYSLLWKLASLPGRHGEAGPGASQFTKSSLFLFWTFFS